MGNEVQTLACLFGALWREALCELSQWMQNWFLLQEFLHHQKQFVCQSLFITGPLLSVLYAKDIGEADFSKLNHVFCSMCPAVPALPPPPHTGRIWLPKIEQPEILLPVSRGWEHLGRPGYRTKAK